MNMYVYIYIYIYHAFRLYCPTSVVFVQALLT